MADEENGTTEGTEEAQADKGTAQAAPASPVTLSPEEVTKLVSRNSGLDAKVSTLSEQLKVEREARAAAEQRALELAAGKDNGDAELRAQLTKLEQERDQAKLEALIGTRAAQYPEAFGVFGAGVASMAEEALAAAEARFKGVSVAAAAAPVRPISNNQSREQSNQGALTAKERYAEKVKAFNATPVPWESTD